MEKFVFLCMVAVVMLALFLRYGATAKTMSHEQLVSSYEGSKTCERCHPGVIDDVLQSVHYKLKGPVSTIEGLSGEWGEINRECGLPGSIYKLNELITFRVNVMSAT